MCGMVVPASATAWVNPQTADVALHVAGVFAVAWVLRIIVVCIARKDYDDLADALDSVRPAREFRWWTRRRLDHTARPDPERRRDKRTKSPRGKGRKPRGGKGKPRRKGR